jgi:hypothetical protein
MTSRSYLIAGSLVVGYAIVACPAEPKDAPTVQVEAPKPDVAVVTPVHEPDPVPEPDPEPEPSPEPVSDTDEATDAGAEPVPVPTAKKKRTKRCPPHTVRFDGKCLSEKKAKLLQEQRDEKHLRELKKAKTPVEESKAQKKLTEDQIQQVDVLEDKLDDIYDKLADKKAKGEGPFGKSDDPFDG